MGLEYFTTNTDASSPNTSTLPSSFSPSVQTAEKAPQAFHLWSQLLPSLSNTDPASPSDERSEAIEDSSEARSALGSSNRSPKPPRASSSRRVTGRTESFKVGTRPANSSWAQLLPSLRGLIEEQPQRNTKIPTTSSRNTNNSIRKSASLSTPASPSPNSQPLIESNMASTTSAPNQTYSSFAQMLPSLNGTYVYSEAEEEEEDTQPTPLPQLTKPTSTPQPDRIVASSEPAVHSFAELLPSLNGSYVDEEATEETSESTSDASSQDHSWEEAYGWEASAPTFQPPKSEYKVPALAIETVQSNAPFGAHALEGLEKHVLDAVKERKDSAISLSYDLVQG